MFDLTYAKDFDPSALVFKEPVPGINSKDVRIPIEYDQKDHTLILAPDGCDFFSFGVQPSDKYPNSVKVVPIVINLDDPNADQLEFVKKIRSLHEKCVKHVCDNKEKIRSLSKYNDKEIVEMFKCPVHVVTPKDKKRKQYLSIRPKLWMSKEGNVVTRFYDLEQKLMETPDNKKSMHLFPALMFDSIYINATGITLQTKLFEAFVTKVVDTKIKIPILDISKLRIE
jgi:hypothetical protein